MRGHYALARAQRLARFRMGSSCAGQSWRIAGSKSAPFGQARVWTSRSIWLLAKSTPQIAGRNSAAFYQAATSGIVKLMRLIEARYEEGLLKPEKPLALRPGERVALVVVRHPDPKRWDLDRLAKSGEKEDLALAEKGLAEWADTLDREDQSGGP